MNLEGLAVDLERCPDGVELVDLPHKTYEVTRGPRVLVSRVRGTAKGYRYRTDRRQTEQKMIENLEDPVVVAFVNATADRQRLPFFGRYGLGTKADQRLWNRDDNGDPRDFKEQALDYDRLLQTRLRFQKMLEDATGEDQVAAMTAINAAMGLKATSYNSLKPEFHLAGPRGAPRMLLKSETLTCFMLMELAMIITHGVRSTKCEQCGVIVLTGQLTGRRSSVRFCSDKCRVAANRARQAEISPSGGGK